MPNALTTPYALNAHFSGFFWAMRFGTSSPKTSEKYDSTIVMSTVNTGTGHFLMLSGSTMSASLPAKLFAAKADDRKPASVTPT